MIVKGTNRASLSRMAAGKRLDPRRGRRVYEEREGNEDTNGQDSKRSRPSWPKKKVAIMMGYSGSGYQGMQLNPNARTIEAELFEALCKDGLISADNAVDPKKVGWMRSCRTDKGVHAAGQVVSVKMLLKPEEEDGNKNEEKPVYTADIDDAKENESEKEFEKIFAATTERLNRLLPLQIRIFGIRRTVNSFQAKERTDSRFYEYLLPTYMFRPLDNPEIYKTALNEAPEKTAVVVEADAPQIESDDEENIIEEAEEDKAQHAYSEPTEEEMKLLQAYRMPADLQECIRQMLAIYHGSHHYHNFTIGMNSSNPSARRNIISTHLGTPFIRPDGREWVSIVFHGQSFMLHQIRKMVGLVVMAARLAPAFEGAESLVERLQGLTRHCLNPAVRVNIPKAPAEGLLLDKAVFQGYNLHNPEHLPIEFDDFDQERRHLKETIIYPTIYEAEETKHCFAGWLKCNDHYAGEFGFLLNH